MQVIFTCTLTPIPLVLLEEHKRHFFKEQFCSCSFPTLCTGKRCWEFPVEAKRPTSKSPTANTHHIRASAHRSSMQHKILSLPLTSVCQELSFTFTEAGKAELKDVPGGLHRTKVSGGHLNSVETGHYMCLKQTYLQVPGCEILYLVVNLHLAASVSPLTETTLQNSNNPCTDSHDVQT